MLAAACPNGKLLNSLSLHHALVTDHTVQRKYPKANVLTFLQVILVQFSLPTTLN